MRFPDKKRKLRLALATSLAATLIALLIGEVAMRRMYGTGFGVYLDPYEDHPYRPYLDYRMTWGPAVTQVYTNSLGWRDARPGHRVEKDPGARTRIVFLGDSFTEGVGVEQGKTITGTVQALLGPAGYEVLNGGRNSYCPLLEYQRLRRFLEKGYRTDAVVVLPDMSDVFDEVSYRSRYELGPGGEPLRFREGLSGPVTRLVYNHSALARSIRLLQKRAADRIAAPPQPPPSSDGAAGADGLPETGVLTLPQVLSASEDQQRILRSNWMFHRPSLDGWAQEGLRFLIEDLDRIHRLASRHSIPMMVVLYPWPNMLYQREDAGLYALLSRRFPRLYLDRERVAGRRPGPAEHEYRRRVLDLCRRRSIPVVDLYPVIQAQGRWWALHPGRLPLQRGGEPPGRRKDRRGLAAGLASHGK